MRTRQNTKIWITITLLLFFACIALAATPILLTKLQIKTVANNTQVILSLSDSPHYKVFTLSHPSRLAIDLPTVKLATALNKVALTKPILRVRSGHPTADTLRIVLDLANPIQPQTRLQTDRVNTNKQLIVTLYDKSNTIKTTVAISEKLQGETKNATSATTLKATTNAKTTIPDQHLQQTQQWTQETLPQATAVNTESLKKNVTTRPSPTTTKSVAIPQNLSHVSTEVTETIPAAPTLIAAPKAGHRPIIVIIDPGHGGKDPGTSGSLGVQEKDVVLAISLNLNKILARHPGYKAIMTRDSDYFIPLRGRLAIARRHRGDMFIAIHADAFKDPYASGASVFALSPHGASSEAARWLAEKENYSELGSVSLRDKSDMLRSVLIDLSQTATVAASMQLGVSLLQQLGQIGNLHHKYVEQAPFMVLKSPDIPSVLVETGFLSNAEEQTRLRNPVDQAQIANALAKGIFDYFKKNPPPGTLVAAQIK